MFSKTCQSQGDLRMGWGGTSAILQGYHLQDSLTVLLLEEAGSLSRLQVTAILQVDFRFL